MSIEFKDNIPIYLQIVEDIKMQIMANKLKEDDKVSSVRELALIYGVTPNTVQKALSELERENLVKTERTSGRYICATKQQINDMKEKIAKEEIMTFLQKMKDIGYDRKTIIEMIERSQENEQINNDQ